MGKVGQILLAIGLIGCPADDLPPAAGGSGGPPLVGGINRGNGTDSGADGADGGDVLGCSAIGAGDGNTLLVTDAGTAVEFEETATFVRWDRTLCDDDEAVLIFAITDGDCVPGAGRQLQFRIARDREDVLLGGNPITGVDDEVEIRLNMPDPPSTGDTEWGNCRGMGSGDVIFSEVGFEAGQLLVGTYSLNLVDCGPPARATDRLVSGRFSMIVTQDYDEACM